MSEKNINNINNTLNGKLVLEKGDWFYITSAQFCSIADSENLVWKSINPNIVQINPNSGLIYAKNEGVTSVIGASEDNSVRVLCAIQVQQPKATITTTVIDTPRTVVAPACSGNCSNDVIAFGYSGTVFSYTEVGNRVTLEKGFGAKNGTSNIYSDLFRSALVQMNNIYASMSPTQRGVWMGLRIGGLIPTIEQLLKGNYEELARDYIKDIIIQNALNLDELEATLLGLRSWYTVEDNAVSYYEAF